MENHLQPLRQSLFLQLRDNENKASTCTGLQIHVFWPLLQEGVWCSGSLQSMTADANPNVPADSSRSAVWRVVFLTAATRLNPRWYLLKCCICIPYTLVILFKVARWRSNSQCERAGGSLKLSVPKRQLCKPALETRLCLSAQRWPAASREEEKLIYDTKIKLVLVDFRLQLRKSWYWWGNILIIEIIIK